MFHPKDKPESLAQAKLGSDEYNEILARREERVVHLALEKKFARKLFSAMNKPKAQQAAVYSRVAKSMNDYATKGNSGIDRFIKRCVEHAYHYPTSEVALVLMNKLVPGYKSTLEPIAIDMPEGTLGDKAAAVISAIGSGQLSVDHGREILSVIETALVIESYDKPSRVLPAGDSADLVASLPKPIAQRAPKKLPRKSPPPPKQPPKPLSVAAPSQGIPSEITPDQEAVLKANTQNIRPGWMRKPK